MCYLKKHPLLNLCAGSLRFEYTWWAKRKVCEPHETEGFRVLPGTTILLAHKGEYRCWMNGAYYQTGPGQVLIVPANTKHRIVFPHSGVISGVVIGFNLFGGIDVLSCYRMPVICSKADTRKINSLVEALAKIWLEAPRDVLTSAVESNEYAWRLLHLIIKLSKVRKNKRSIIDASQRIAPVMEYMHRNMGQKLTRSSLAKLIHLSPDRFHHVFTETIKQSPMAYLNGLRLRRAGELLLVSDRSIADIAEEVGFCDQFHFSKKFKKAFGKSPQSYRKFHAPLFE